MKVVTTTLEMFAPAGREPRPLPDGIRLDRTTTISPEYARFLYALVGGPWNWTDRLAWAREQWADELAVPGTEFHILYGDGEPLGYVHLQPLEVDGATHVEIRYFGLAERAIGRGLGGALLEHGIAAAWAMPNVSRVWVHTCTLDGPAALTNYQARGLVVCGTEETDEAVPEHPIGSWASTTGLGVS